MRPLPSRAACPGRWPEAGLRAQLPSQGAKPSELRLSWVRSRLASALLTSGFVLGVGTVPSSASPPQAVREGPLCPNASVLPHLRPPRECWHLTRVPLTLSRLRAPEHSLSCWLCERGFEDGARDAGSPGPGDRSLWSSSLHPGGQNTLSCTRSGPSLHTSYKPCACQWFRPRALGHPQPGRGPGEAQWQVSVCFREGHSFLSTPGRPAQLSGSSLCPKGMVEMRGVL